MLAKIRWQIDSTRVRSSGSCHADETYRHLAALWPDLSPSVFIVVFSVRLWSYDVRCSPFVLPKNQYSPWTRPPWCTRGTPKRTIHHLQILTLYQPNKQVEVIPCPHCLQALYFLESKTGTHSELKASLPVAMQYVLQNNCPPSHNKDQTTSVIP